MAGIEGLIEDISKRIIVEDLDLISRALFALTSTANYLKFFPRSLLSSYSILVEALAVSNPTIVEFIIETLLGNPKLPLTLKPIYSTLYIGLSNSGRKYLPGFLLLVPRLNSSIFPPEYHFRSLQVAFKAFTWNVESSASHRKGVGHLYFHVGFSALNSAADDLDLFFRRSRYNTSTLRWFWAGAAAGGFLQRLRTLPLRIQESCCRSVKFISSLIENSLVYDNLDSLMFIRLNFYLPAVPFCGYNVDLRLAAMMMDITRGAGKAILKLKVVNWLEKTLTGASEKYIAKVTRTYFGKKVFFAYASKGESETIEVLARICRTHHLMDEVRLDEILKLAYGKLAPKKPMIVMGPNSLYW